MIRDQSRIVHVARLKDGRSRSVGGTGAERDLLADTRAKVRGVEGSVRYGVTCVGHGDGGFDALIADPPCVAPDTDCTRLTGNPDRQEILFGDLYVVGRVGHRLFADQKLLIRRRGGRRGGRGGKHGVGCDARRFTATDEPGQRRWPRARGVPHAGEIFRRGTADPLTGRRHAGVGAGVFLELGHGDVQGEEGVLAGLGLALGVAGDGGLHARVGREANQQDHQKREQRDRDEQREAGAGTTFETDEVLCAWGGQDG